MAEGSIGKNGLLFKSLRGKEALVLGTLGFFNKALLMKKAWRIQEHPHLLLSMVLHRNCNPGQGHLRKSTQSSWGCHDIVMANNLLQQHNHWKVGDGNTIGVSSHPWLNGKTPIFRDDKGVKWCTLEF